MNKLSLFAFSVLLILGALMWGLANISMQDFVKEQILTIGKKATGNHIGVGDIGILAQGNISYITDLEMTDSTGKTLLSIASISILVETESLKSPEIIVKNIEFNQVTHTATAENLKADLIDNIEQYIKNSAQASLSHLPKFTIQKISFSFDDNNTSSKQLPISNQEKTSSPADIAFLQVFSALLKEIN